MSYFPMFIELQDKRCLVVGGGKVAYRKVKVLRDFGAQVTVMAEQILPEIKCQEDVIWREKRVTPEDIEGWNLVIAATDDKEWNHRIAEKCRQQKIPVNAVDQIEDCSFIFPAYLKQGEVVAAFSSGGNSPVVTQYLKEQAKPVMTERLGAIAGCLGELREQVKQCVETEAERRQVYQELLEIGLEGDRIPTAEEIEVVINTHIEKSVDKKKVCAHNVI